MKAYYSHAKLLRNSKQEAEDIKSLESVGFIVDNPYHPKYSDCWESDGIDFGKVLIGENDIFIFRSLPNGKIPVGVGKELRWAQEAGKPILELPFALSNRFLNMDETMEFFKQSGR